MLIAIYILLILFIILDLVIIYIFMNKDEPKQKQKRKEKVKRILPEIPVPTLNVEEKDAISWLAENQSMVYARPLYRYCLPLITSVNNPTEMIEISSPQMWENNPPDLFHIDEGEIPDNITPEGRYSRAINIIGGMSANDLQQGYDKINKHYVNRHSKVIDRFNKTGKL